MASNFIARQVRDGESYHTEFKSGVGSAENIARTVCAFLNSGGGTILCGLDDRGRAIGIENAAAELERLERALQRTISPKALYTMSVEIFEGTSIIIIEVPEGKDRPYVVDGSVYVRQGHITRAADARTLRNMVQDKSATTARWERQTADALEFEDLSKDEIEVSIDAAQRSGRFSFDNPDNLMGALRDLSMVTPTGFTHAADVMFGRHSFRRLPQCRIRLIRFRSDKGGSEYEDDRWFQGPLVPAFNEAYEAVTQSVRVQSYFAEGRVARVDRPQYAFEALREGLVNAIAHRDYSSFSGGVTISIYPDRIEIWNAGRLPDELETRDLKKNHPSIPTNPDISHVLYLRKLMERIGRGTQKIIASTKELGAPPPRWIDRPSGVTLTLFAADPAGNIELDLNIRQLELLRALQPGDLIDSTAYAESVANSVAGRQARRDLLGLEEAGYLIRRGGGRLSRYERTHFKFE
jgi:ATP-dependent DNA helicase RecG